MKPVYLLVASVISLFAPPSLAEKPAWAGNKHGKIEKEGRPAQEGGAPSLEFRFGVREREIIGGYFQQQAKAGKCPPGLAKKGNGCQPPGQAKRWRVGQALPRDLEIHALPQELSVRLPLPPAGHRYVQVAADILLIAVGTGMVIDAVEDLLR